MEFPIQLALEGTVFEWKQYMHIHVITDDENRIIDIER